MGCMGGLRAVTGKELGRLRALPREARNIDYLDRELVQEDAYDMDKSWDAIHRALTGGKLEYGNPPAPGGWAVLGGEVLRGGREGEEDYIVVCKSPKQVRQVDQFLRRLTEDAFRELYFAIDPADYGFELNEDDFDYSWENLADSRPFWHRAAEKGLWVLFDVDQ